MSDHVSNDRFDAAVKGIRDAISVESAQTRRELNDNIDRVRQDTNDAHGRIREDLTEFRAETINERALMQARLDEHGRRIKSLEGNDRGAWQPQLTRAQKTGIVTVLLGLTGWAVDVVVHAGALLKRFAEVLK